MPLRYPDPLPRTTRPPARAPRTGDDGTVPALLMPSLGPDALPVAAARDAVVGYARARRPLRFRSPSMGQGRWVSVPAYGWARFDARVSGPPGEDDVLVGELLHGRLDRAGWASVDETLARLRPVAEAAEERAGGRALWALADDELSVLGEPGTVGAALRAIGRDAGPHPDHVSAALHHRRPALVPHLTRTTRRALLPHLEEGDSGVEAVVAREVRANDAAFAALEIAVAEVLGPPAPTRLRLHDLLLWLTTTLRMPHAAAAGAAAVAAGCPDPVPDPSGPAR